MCVDDKFSNFFTSYIVKDAVHNLIDSMIEKSTVLI